jgi:hypothetical protein
MALLVAGRSTHDDVLALVGLVSVGEERDHREQSQQRRGGPPDRQFRPMPLPLKAQALADLLECALHLPASNKPRDDLLRLGGQIGAKECLGLELFLRVSDQSTQRNGTAGKPVEYQTAVLETISIVRFCLPYQFATMIGFQPVEESSATTHRLGKRSPLSRGRPIWPR